MTDEFTDDRWNVFENSVRVADYLYYRGIGVKKFSAVKGDHLNAYNNRGSGDLSEGAGGQ